MKKIKTEYLKKVILKNFSMSEELAKAIGTVVVQALTENAKDESSDFDLGEEDTDDLDDSDLEESSKDAGKVKEADSPKPAPDLSEEFSELKKSKKSFSETRYETVRKFLNM